MSSNVASALNIYPQEKRCSSCGLIKPREAFSLAKRPKDGLQSLCKECRRKSHEVNKTHDNDLSKARHQKNLLADHDRNKRNYEANKEHVLRRCAEYREKNPEKVAEWQRYWFIKNRHYVRQWHKDHREARRYIEWAISSLKCHKNRGFEIDISASELVEIAMITPHCPLCGVTLFWEPNPGKTRYESPSLDRINNENFIRKDNINIICVRCNATKGSRPLHEFIAYCKTVSERFVFEEGNSDQTTI